VEEGPSREAEGAACQALEAGEGLLLEKVGVVGLEGGVRLLGKEPGSQEVAVVEVVLPSLRQVEVVVEEANLIHSFLVEEGEEEEGCLGVGEEERTEPCAVRTGHIVTASPQASPAPQRSSAGLLARASCRLIVTESRHCEVHLVQGSPFPRTQVQRKDA
jgi:hypothetical protein